MSSIVGAPTSSTCFAPAVSSKAELTTPFELVAIVVGLSLGGCGVFDSFELHSDAARCRSIDEHVVTEVLGESIDDVVMVVYAGRPFAIWSQRSGLYARPLDSDGEPTAEPERLARACEAGLAAVASDEAIQLACGHRGDDSKDDIGGLHRIAYQPGQSSVVGARIGAMGTDGEGVALARDDDGHWFVGWQRSEGADRQAWVQSESDPPLRLSPPHLLSSPPSFLSRPHGVWLTWSEVEVAGRDISGRVWLRAFDGALRGRPQSIAELAWDQALPTLTPGPFLTFRDRMPARSRPRLRFGRIDPDRMTIERIEQGVHANARGAAIAIECNGVVASIAPRTHSRRERLVSVRAYDEHLRPLADELQLYEYGMAYERAAALCVDGRVLVLMAGRGPDGSGAVRTSLVRCGEAPRGESERD